MLIGIPKEIKTREYRVGMLPAGVRELTALGHQVLVETNAATRIGVTDSDYVAAGARIAANREQVFSEAELIVKVKEPLLDECRLLRRGQTIFTYLHLAAVPEIAEALLSSGVCGIAYETVIDATGHLPLLTPMSEVAGRMSIQAAMHFLEITQGGRGVLLSGVPGVAPGKVVILGGGVVGRNAAQVAVGLGAEVVIIDRNAMRMRELEQLFGSKVRTLFSSPEEILRQIASADVVIGAVLVAGAAAPMLVSRQILSLIQKGSVIVDVAIDQGGCFETSRPTTHDDPVFEVDGILHYCVANMPGAVPRTSTMALTSVTLPYVIALAEKGISAALKADPFLCAGLNVMNGQITHPGVAAALGKPYIAPANML